MDGNLGVNTADTYYISNEQIIKCNNKKPIEDKIILTETYDDVQQPEQCANKPNVNLPNQDNCQCTNGASDGNRFKYVGKRCMTCLVVIGWLTGVALVVFSYKLNTSQGISSSSKPLMNPDLCDPVNSYYLSTWFMPCPMNSFSCDVPILISEIYIQALVILGIDNFDNCQNKLDCMSVIGLYLVSNDSKYNFFVDHNSNVYAGRDWLCPFKSGQLWVGMITNKYPVKPESEEMNRTLKHFKTEIFSYAMKCSYFVNSGLRIIYLNNTNIA